MAVLYRTYRPQSFQETVGQSHIIQTLKNSAKSGSPSHAYLFTGGRGTGKTTLARVFAKAVNCLNLKDGEVCLVCPSCLAIANNTFLDLVEIDAASNTGVENVRELIEHVKFQPTQGRYKVFIIDEVHMLSKAAFNALLKTLEEPPSHVIFILATTEIQKVPATIISRTQRFDFSQIPENQIQTRLLEVLKKEGSKLSLEIVTLIARQAGGGLRDALSILDKILSLGDNVSLEEVESALGVTDVSSHHALLDLILGNKPQEIPQFFEGLAGRGVEFSLFTKDFLEYLRKALLLKIVGNSQNLVLDEVQANLINKQINNLAVSQLLYIIRLFLRAYKEIPQAPTSEMPVLLASIEACLGPDKSAIGMNPQTVVAAVPSQKTETKVTPVVTKAEIIETEDLPEIVEKNIPKVGTDNISLEELQVVWPQVIAKIKVNNSPLSTLVKNSPILGIENGTILLGVKYIFHKEHLESTKHYSLITGIITELTGKNLSFNARVAPKQLAEELNATEALGSVLQVFGGELVE